MTSARAIEYRITQRIIHTGRVSEHQTYRLVKQLIAATAIAGGMLLLGSVFQELLIALIAATVISSIALS